MGEIESNVDDVFSDFIEAEQGGKLAQLARHEVGAPPLLALRMLA